MTPFFVGYVFAGLLILGIIAAGSIVFTSVKLLAVHRLTRKFAARATLFPFV